MRKTLATILLGTTLFTTACSKKYDAARGEAVREADRAELAGDLRRQEEGKLAPPAPAGAAADTAMAMGSGYAAAPPAAEPAQGKRDVAGEGGEGYRDYGVNPWTDAAKDRLSTFAADVDTASYTLARRKLSEGALP